jgi:hypothetical protein
MSFYTEHFERAYPGRELIARKLSQYEIGRIRQRTAKQYSLVWNEAVQCVDRIDTDFVYPGEFVLEARVLDDKVYSRHPGYEAMSEKFEPIARAALGEEFLTVVAALFKASGDKGTITLLYRSKYLVGHLWDEKEGKAGIVSQSVLSLSCMVPHGEEADAVLES